MPTRNIIVPNQFAVIQSQLSMLLGMCTEEVQLELQNGWEHSVRTTWLLNWTHILALRATGESYQCNACHGFLLLIFGTLLFLHASNLIDGALTQVVLQEVGGHSYVEVLVAETVRSLDYVREIRCGRMRGFSEWRQFLEELTPRQFLWATRKNPGGPMITGCPGIVRLPLISHLGSTLVFPSRVIRQLDGLQDFPTEADRITYRFMSNTRVTHDLYFSEHSTDEERALSTTSAYVAQFYSQDAALIHRPRATQIPRALPAITSKVKSSAQATMHTELQSIREERDRLRYELVETRVELVDHRELQRELAQARARVASQDGEIARLSATLDQVRVKARKVSYLLV
ncbi:hypothetical protein CRG98_039583 [Punica granatum]|uniref:Aminotransferase-like plant mobile domain-containing protein n=1 Tax=Punica granatum TaxID=22663 RepID=A0A2I0I886_PUNGR|nr:hypothetical protein CRG98_039583 [Punica granatum]